MTTKKKVMPEGIVIHLTQKGPGWVGYAAKDGVVLKEITDATLYHSVAGQLREFLDLGPYK
jgi:hypothetical protein